MKTLILVAEIFGYVSGSILIMVGIAALVASHRYRQDETRCREERRKQLAYGVTPITSREQKRAA